MLLDGFEPGGCTGYRVDTIVADLKLDYSEDADLEQPAEGDAEPEE